MWSAIVVCVVAALLLLYQGLNATGLTSSKPFKGLLFSIALLTGLVACPVLWFSLNPGEPAVSIDLSAPGQQLVLGDSGPGVLRVSGKPVEGSTAKKGTIIVAKLQAAGGDSNDQLVAQFQLGSLNADAAEDGIAMEENLAANLPVGVLGSGATLTLSNLAPPGVVTLTVDYFPQRLPLQIMLYALIGLTLLAALFEGAGDSRYLRSFLTAVVAGVTGLTWILRDGLTANEGMMSLALRVGYAIGIAALVGTILPMITGVFMPKLPQEDQPASR
ncbi:MAG: hypothetical protein ACI9OJ_000870 [Myxococcota bacterium]|jgi:hypothetical protein